MSQNASEVSVRVKASMTRMSRFMCFEMSAVMAGSPVSRNTGRGEEPGAFRGESGAHLRDELLVVAECLQLDDPARSSARAGVLSESASGFAPGFGGR